MLRTKTVVLYAALAPVVLAAGPPAPGQVSPRRDPTKESIERPAGNVLAGAAEAPAGEGFVNPKVAPGKVKWHANFATACAAARKSNRPVLLFQMMGKLDEQFC